MSAHDWFVFLGILLPLVAGVIVAEVAAFCALDAYERRRRK